MFEGEHRSLSQAERLGYHDSDITSLNAGVPGVSILKMLPHLMEKATVLRMNEELAHRAQLFQYGIEEGNYEFREALSEFLTAEYGDTVDSKNLILTSGASSSLWNILTILFKPGVVVFVEDVTYFIAIKMFREFGATIVPVKTDAEGIIPEDFTRILTTWRHSISNSVDKFTLPLRALLYLVPVFHNPTGRTMNKERCHHIIQISALEQILIVCDDVYNLLHHNAFGFSPFRMFAYTQYNNVISNGSFSKFLAPGLRLGWLEAPEWMVEKYKKWSVVDSGGGLNTYTAGIVTTLMTTGLLKEHVQAVREEYKRRMLTFENALNTHLPEGCTVMSPCNGGYFIWIKLPTDMDAKCFQAFCKKEYQISILPGSNASTTGDHNNYARLSVSLYEGDILEQATKTFARAIQDYQEKLAVNEDFRKIYANDQSYPV